MLCAGLMGRVGSRARGSPISQREQLCTGWPLNDPLPGPEGWPGDEGAWGPRDKHTQDAGPRSARSRGHVLWACAVSVLISATWKHFDLPACDGLHRARRRAARTVMCCRADATSQAAEPC